MTSANIPHSALYTDFYQLTMSQGYFKVGTHQKKAYFDYFFRETPFDGEYVIFAGLADLLPILESMRFTKDEREWLSHQGFHSDFCEFLKDFRFDGTITSVSEGDIVFPGEPVLTVSGSLLSCQLIETLLLNILNFQSLIATKASRLRYACGNRKIIDFGMRRGQSTGVIAASRAAFIGGVDATSNVATGFQHNIPVSGTMAHSWVQSFDSELEAFRRYAEFYPDKCILLVDTYDTLKSGMPNAIKVGLEMAKKGHDLAGIRLDSGDPLLLSREARRLLDEAGLANVSIVVSDQLDEHMISSLVQNEAPIDFFGVGTRLITGYPDGALSGVYKICNISGRPTMKYTDDIIKSNLPGIKDLIREEDQSGYFRRDHIVINSESEKSQSLIEDQNADITIPGSKNIRTCVMENGRMLGHPANIREIAEFCGSRLAYLPENIKRLSKPERFDIRHGETLETLMNQLKKVHYERIDCG